MYISPRAVGPAAPALLALLVALGLPLRCNAAHVRRSDVASVLRGARGEFESVHAASAAASSVLDGRKAVRRVTVEAVHALDRNALDSSVEDSRDRSHSSDARKHAVADTRGGLDEALWSQVGFLIEKLFTDNAETLNATETLKVHSIIKKIRPKMALRDALPRLQSKLPVEMMSLAWAAAGKKSNRSGYDFTEASLAKALSYFNDMMFSSWKELDQATISCKEFVESNRGTFSQVQTDLENMGSQLADQERVKSKSLNEIQEMSEKIKEVEGLRTNLQREYMKTRSENQLELQLRTDDLEVFHLILEMTRCQSEGSTEYSVSLVQKSGLPLQICDTKNGTVIRSLDPKLSAKLKHSLRAEQALLGAFEAAQLGGLPAAAALLQRGLQAPEPVPTATKPAGDSQWKKCRTPKVPNCGLIHDTMALQWGKLKDLVDELTVEMEHNADVYDKELTGMNEQTAIFRQQKQKMQELLAETTSEGQTLRAAQSEKQIQQRDLESAYQTRMKQCKSRVQEILYTNICAVRVVRDTIMDYSEVSPAAAIGDCDFTDFTGGPCSVDCDDNCPSHVGGTDPYKCGGFQTLSREMVAAPNQYGMACPPMMMQKKCHQIKCPVSCQMSEWSGYSKCTAECGGGNQQRTRSILVKPRNGGNECDTTVDERPCSTGSCDRDCVLDTWSAWSGCSAACGGGVHDRVRNVIVPIRAMGKCPDKDHPDRLQEQDCNTQACQGDEVCVARQDLVIAIDASGSVKESGFEMIRSLAGNLTKRYRSTYYGKDRMRVGVLVFGQGRYMDAGYISAAEEAEPLTFDMDAVTSSITALTWKRGLTNMMQALKLADKMLEKGRSDAQSAILLITDGKYTNAFRTSQKIQQLKEKNIKIFMAPISQFEADNLEVLKQWASQPWQQNYLRIPGYDALNDNYDNWAQSLVVQFCPESLSPEHQRTMGEQEGFTLVRTGGYPSADCSKGTKMPEKYASPDACFDQVKAMHEGANAFTFMKGSGRLHGVCIAETVEVTAETWQGALWNATDVECPGGKWEESPYAFTYFMNPDRVSLSASASE
jgi:uncharacterized protein YegL